MSGQQKSNNGIGYSLIGKFKEGDLVSWKSLGLDTKNYAFIVKIMHRNVYGNRSFYTARLITSQGEEKEINLGLLKLESRPPTGE